MSDKSGGTGVSRFIQCPRNMRFDRGSLKYVEEGSCADFLAAEACFDSNVADLTDITVVEGFTLAAGQVVVLQGQTDPTQNGIYDVVPGTVSGFTLVKNASLTALANAGGLIVLCGNTGTFMISTVGGVFTDISYQMVTGATMGWALAATTGSTFVVWVGDTDVVAGVASGAITQILANGPGRFLRLMLRPIMSVGTSIVLGNAATPAINFYSAGVLVGTINGPVTLPQDVVTYIDIPASLAVGTGTFADAPTWLEVELVVDQSTSFTADIAGTLEFAANL